MSGKLFAILKFELVLSALFRGAGGNDPVGGRVAENGRTKLLVDKDAGLVLLDAGCQRRFEPVIDDLFGAGDLRGLHIAQMRLPAEQLALERATMVERQEVKRVVPSAWHQLLPLSWR